MESTFLTVAQIIELHDVQIARYGGLEGIKNLGLLESAAEQPQASMFGQLFHPDLSDQAAAYLFHLIQNHPFNDANKRTALSATLTFLNLNGYPRGIPQSEAFDLTLRVAKGELDKGTLAEVIAGYLAGQAEPAIEVEASVEFWREVDASALQHIEDQSEIPVLRKLGEALKQIMLEHRLFRFTKRVGREAHIGFDVNGNFVLRNLDIDVFDESSYRRACQELAFPTRRMKQALGMSEIQQLQGFAREIGKAMIALGIFHIRFLQEGGVVGWTPREDGEYGFTGDSLAFAYMPEEWQTRLKEELGFRRISN